MLTTMVSTNVRDLYMFQSKTCECFESPPGTDTSTKYRTVRGIFMNV